MESDSSDGDLFITQRDPSPGPVEQSDPEVGGEPSSSPEGGSDDSVEEESFPSRGGDPDIGLSSESVNFMGFRPLFTPGGQDVKEYKAVFDGEGHLPDVRDGNEVVSGVGPCLPSQVSSVSCVTQSYLTAAPGVSSTVYSNYGRRCDLAAEFGSQVFPVSAESCSFLPTVSAVPCLCTPSDSPIEILPTPAGTVVCGGPNTTTAVPSSGSESKTLFDLQFSDISDDDLVVAATQAEIDFAKSGVTCADGGSRDGVAVTGRFRDPMSDQDMEKLGRRA